MRRALVLTDESARHPFRACLPPSWRKLDEVENRRSWRLNFLGLDEDDARCFVGCYLACFIAVSLFIL